MSIIVIANDSIVIQKSAMSKLPIRRTGLSNSLSRQCKTVSSDIDHALLKPHANIPGWHKTVTLVS
ncbi:hypothetical protein A3759_03130 [Thalassolituus sp. HI0120]|nr:hypothetical protein A3759_03130 [Thalassolituus sp. HI0120]